MYIDIHTHKQYQKLNTKSVFNLERENHFVSNLFSSGIHPWFIQEEKLAQIFEKLKSNLALKQAVLLGECGLDKSIETALELQKKVLKAQLELNKTFHKPVILHCVRAYDEILQIIKDFPFNFIFHGFNKNEILAKQLVAKGHYLSFGKALLQNKKVQQAFKEIPLENIFLETDDTDFEIEELYLKAAELKQVSVEKLQAAIEKNWNKIIRITDKNILDKI